MRRLGVLALLLVVAGCGGGDDPPKAADAAAAAKYLPKDSQLVVAVDLDEGDAQWKQLEKLYTRVLRSGTVGRDLGVPLPPTLTGALTLGARFAGLDYEEDVKPLLHGTVLIGARVTPAPAAEPAPAGADVAVPAPPEPEVEAVVAFEAPDKGRLDELIEKLAKQGVEPRPVPGVKDGRSLGGGLGVVGRTVVLALGDDPEAALADRLGAFGPPAAGLPTPAEGKLLRIRATPQLLGAVLDGAELARALETNAGKALRGAEASFALTDKGAAADGRVDFEGLADAELPLGPAKALELPADVGLGSASADQQRTTVFLATLARALYPGSRFVRRVEAAEKALGITFEDEVLRQFSGPSASVLRAAGDGTTEFYARSSLRDPAAMRALLPRLAPRMPGILEGLEALGSTGLAGLLLVAPDAPLTPAASAILGAVTLKPVPKAAAQGDELLFELSGLENAGAVERVTYGVIGDTFVVGSSTAMARKAATMRTEPAEPAGSRLHVDVRRLLEESGEQDESARDAVLAFATDIDVEAAARDGDIVARMEVRAGG